MSPVSMKLIFTLLIAMTAIGSRAQAASDLPAVHGMLVFGNDKVYLSHLPMFHSPHDYQVILEVQLSPQAKALYANSLKNFSETVYTLVPEPFVLSDMIANPQPFHAKLFRGHFERGGAMIADNVEVTIAKVLYFKKFLPDASPPPHDHYLAVGNLNEAFLLHIITARPDFDQVIKLKPSAELVSALRSNGTAILDLPDVNNTQPVKVPSPLMAQTATAKNLTIQAEAELYLEFNDLQM